MKNIIITAIVSVVVTASLFHAYAVYQINKATVQNTQSIQEIVNFLNKNTPPQGKTEK